MQNQTCYDNLIMYYCVYFDEKTDATFLFFKNVLDRADKKYLEGFKDYLIDVISDKELIKEPLEIVENNLKKYTFTK